MSSSYSCPCLSPATSSSWTISDPTRAAIRRAHPRGRRQALVLAPLLPRPQPDLVFIVGVSGATAYFRSTIGAVRSIRSRYRPLPCAARGGDGGGRPCRRALFGSKSSELSSGPCLHLDRCRTHPRRTFPARRRASTSARETSRGCAHVGRDPLSLRCGGRASDRRRRRAEGSRPRIGRACEMMRYDAVGVPRRRPEIAPGTSPRRWCRSLLRPHPVRRRPALDGPSGLKPAASAHAAGIVVCAPGRRCHRASRR